MSEIVTLSHFVDPPSKKFYLLYYKFKYKVILWLCIARQEEIEMLSNYFYTVHLKITQIICVI